MKYRDGLFVIACVLIFISNSRARNISPNQELPIQVSNRIISSNGMRLTLEIAEPEWRTIDSGNERVSFANYNLMTGYLEERGLPSVPVTSRTFRLPPRKSARLEILETNYETYTDIDYAAYFGGSTPGELGQIKSPGDSWYPGKLAELSNPSNRHDFRVSSLITYPVQVNPARREVRVYNRIDVDIHFEEDNNSDLPDQIPARISKTFLPWYRQFLDWDENELDEYELYRGGVQVVMPDDEDLWDDLDPWIEWKLQKGWELDFLTDNDVDDWEAEDIQEELRDRYQAQPFDYVVIIGDADGSYATPAGINVTNTDYGIFADYYYQLMDDDDIYQDVIVGRISVRNGTELERYVQKVLSYECDPYMDDTDWYLQGACLAIYDYHPIGGTSVCEYIRSELFNIGYTDVFYYSSPNGPEPARSNLITHINDGVSYFQCSGAIADGLTRQQILNLTNENKPFVAIQLSHGTGKWSVETAAISEAFIRAWNNGEPTGAIGAFGQATNRANWGYENSFAAGAFYTTARLRLPTLGQMLWGGQKNMFIDFYPYRTGTYTYQNYAECINLMGDPLVWLWTDIPAELDIDAEESIVLGQHSYPVEISDEDGNPVEGAWVTMYKSDDNEYEIVRGESAGDGSILLNLPFEYTGEAVLTVTAQNFQPVQIDVDIDEPDNRIGYTTVNIIDDGEDGTSGNDNGIPEPGETVGLEIDIKNFGGNRQTNISLTASSDDTWIEEIEGSITLDALGPGAEANGTGMILIEISHEAQDRWLNHLELTLESDQDTYTDDYSLKIFAPAYLLLEVSGSEDLEPGETSEIAVEIMNTGGADASASEGHMRILHSFGGMVEPDAEFEAMDIGDAASATFEIRSHMVAIPGFQVPAMLIVTTEDEHLDTVWFSIPLGTRSESEPCGPDRYGYWAYDNRDTDYEKSPEYDWVEISPNANDTDYEGTLQIEDAREGGGEAPVIALPFQVQYYGNDFDSITISNYGWAAFGNQAQFYGTSKNSPIPGPYGPYNMLAPFWDERYFSTDEDGAYTYYDEENGRFIIEWFESKGWLGGGSYSQPCTYEIIIYDRNEQHNTRTGDNEILFQYKNGEIDPHIGYARCNPWWTTGIKDGTQTDGLMYYYHVTPSPGAVDDDNDFDDELSILFTTDVRIIAGSIAGTVTNSITDDPVEGIRVTLDDNYYETFTNEEGQFLLEGVHVGQYSVSFDDECFTDTMLTDIAIAEDETTYVDMPLRHPLLSLDPVEFEEAVDPGTEATFQVSLNNPGNGSLEYSAEYFRGDPDDNQRQENEPWDELHTIDLSPDESNYFGLTFVNDCFYVTGSNNQNAADPNKIYKYDRFGRELLASFDQPVPQNQRSHFGIRELAWDGEYLYGVDNNRIFQMEILPDSITLVDSWRIPLESVTYLEWDSQNDLFWMGNYNSDIYGVDRDGETEARYEREFVPRGLAWNPDDEAERYLYFFAQISSRSDVHVIRMSPSTGEYDTTATIPYPAGRWAFAGVDFSKTWDPLIRVFSTLINQTQESYVQVWYFADNESIVTLDNHEGAVAPGEESVIELLFNSAGIPAGTYPFFLSFANNACEEENNIVSFVLTIPDTTDKIGEPIEKLPLEWSFDGAYPNPFNQTLTVRFALKESAKVRMKIYNLLGQEVAELANLPMTAGRYALPFDGLGLSSGMYFLQFNAGPLNETKKIILLK